MTTCLLGDNGNIAAGVLTTDELDDMMETVWSESVDCPACAGSGARLLPGARPFVLIAEDCEWCEGTGRCTRAVAGEWEEEQR
jgi:excinuclease UvrABC ATPase subunit